MPDPPESNDDLPTRPDVHSFPCPACTGEENVPFDRICDWCFGSRRVGRDVLERWRALHC
jgi:hypothetical protein